MKNISTVVQSPRALFLFCLLFSSFVTGLHAQRAGNNNKSLFSRDNLIAWCIIPFDSKKRNSEERASMLKELGITSFAYDWRANDLPVMETELATMKKHGIDVSAVWFWVNGTAGKTIDEANETILNTLQKTNTHTSLWLSFPETYFQGLTDDEKLKKAVDILKYIHKRASAIGCTVALYNHGDWFGEPENQVRIIRSSGLKDIGIVYNFHHGHHQMDNFKNILSFTKPYLKTVNINGMNAAGPKILTIGDGNRESDLLKTLKQSGFSGSIGIIGHTENEDIKVVLERNLNGLKKLLIAMGDTEAASSYN